MLLNKNLIVFIALSLFVIACGKNSSFPVKPTQTPEVTSINTATPIQIPAPTLMATPIATETNEIVLPAGCLSWLVDADEHFVGYLCDQVNSQEMPITAGKCVFLTAAAPETLAIHYRTTGTEEWYTEIAIPYEGGLCLWYSDTIEVWAETAVAYQAKECLGTLESPDGSINLPLCSFPTAIGLLPGQCLIVKTEHAVKISFNQPTVLLIDTVKSLIKQPGDSLCNGSSVVLNAKIWAELAED